MSKYKELNLQLQVQPEAMLSDWVAGLLKNVHTAGVAAEHCTACTSSAEEVAKSGDD